MNDKLNPNKIKKIQEVEINKTEGRYTIKK